MKKLKIGKFTTAAQEFAFDGCHKFYLIESKECKQDMHGSGWDESDIFPIAELPEMFNTCHCFLKFINRSAVYGFQTIVPQFQKQTSFTWID